MPAITTKKQAEAAILAWLVSVLPAGMPAVIENQNASRPTKNQYVSMYGPRTVNETEINEVVTDAADSIVDADNPGPHLGNVTLNDAFQAGMYYTITVHGNSSTQLADDLAWFLQRAIQSTPARWALDPLAVVEAEEVTAVPQLLESQFEERAQFIVRFRLGMSDAYVVPDIEEVHVIGTLHGGAIDPRTVLVDVVKE